MTNNTSGGGHAGTPRAPLPPIQYAALSKALLARIDSLLPMWLPGGRVQGHEYVCGSLSGGEGSSCSVNRTTGAWSDFATDDKGGDLIALYRAIFGLDTQAKAAVQVARDCGLEDVADVLPIGQHTAPVRPAPPPPPPKPAREPEGWATMVPVPDYAPKPTYSHHHRSPADIVRVSTYKLNGQVLGHVVRFKTSGGGKDDLPHTWCTSQKDGAAKWVWRQFDEPRPLYLPSGLLPTQGQTVVLVEGEKKADVLQALLDQAAPGVYVVASWPGGCKAWAKASWQLLAGSHVLAWPDCDSKREPLTAKERNALAGDTAAIDAAKQAKPYLPKLKQPGMQAMVNIGLLLTTTHGCTFSLLPTDEPGIKPDGWDAADAIEADGWTAERVLAYFAQAHTLPTEAKPADPAAAQGGHTPADGPASAEATDGAGLPWWLEPYFDADKRRWMPSRKLVISALRHDPELQGVLGYNLLSNSLEARRDWPFEHGPKGPVQGATDLLLNAWLSKRYGLPAINRQAIMEAMETVAHEHPWHPIVEWVTGLQWDQKPRVDRWLVHVIGETPATLEPALLEYLTLVGRYWLVGMVKRVIEPGCKFDYCPVLEGKGGLGKSTMVEALATGDWFSDTPFEIGKGKESQEQVQGVWCYELGEMSQMGKATLEAVKQFISAKVDRYRPAYGRTLESHPRQCVLVGTTNERTYLRDRTGNRRFWPVPVRNAIKIDWLKKYRGQLFAEAYQLYLQGAATNPCRDTEARLFVPMQESRIVETAITSMLLHVLTRQPTQNGIGAEVNTLTDYVRLDQLVQALGVDAGKSSTGVESQIRAWMTEQGWAYTKKQINGVRAYMWVRPKDWPPTEDESPTATSLAPAQASPLGNTPTEGDDEPF